MSAEFKSHGYLKDYLICFYYEFKNSSIRQFIKNLLAKIIGKENFYKLIGRKVKEKFVIKQRYSQRYAKKMVLKKKLAISDGKPSWFYKAFQRGSTDPLTNHTLQYIENTLKKESKILITGCGTGITVFHLADCGFKEVVGSDLLPECIDISTQIKNDFHYDNTRFFLDDGFNTRTDEKYDLITALHWVFSAWMGNYGNSPIINPFDKGVREEALHSFLSKYANILNDNGILILELIDAVTDYRLATDHHLGEYSTKIYPIRHSPEQVEKIGKLTGFEVIDKKLSVSYGHHPRAYYYLRKTAS